MLYLLIFSPYLCLIVTSVRAKDAVFADVPSVCDWHQCDLQPVWEQKNEMQPQEIGVGVSWVGQCGYLLTFLSKAVMPLSFWIESDEIL